MNPWRRRPNQPPKPDDSISLEDIEWRIGASDVRPHEEGEADDAKERPVWIGEEEGAAAAAAAASEAGQGQAPTVPKPRKKPASRRAAQQAHPVPVRTRRAAAAEPHAHPVVGAAPRRLTLWRDVSALLFGAVAIVLIFQLTLGNGGETATGTSSPGPSAEQTDVAVIGTDTPAPTSESTIGPVINPSLIPVIQATPTPVPIITLPPTPVPTPRITPRPTVRPVTTPKPTVKPSAAPTPMVTPVPTPAPPVAQISASPATCGSSPILVNFDASTSTGATSWSWNFDDGTSGPGETISHTFTATVSQTQFSVILTVAGPGGSDQTSITITAGPCP